MIVGIDSNIVIYSGLVPRKSSDPVSAEQESLARRAKILLHELRNHQVVLPMVAIAELLIPVPMSKHGQLLSDLREVFICADFGDAAASIAANLWVRYKDLPADQKYDDHDKNRLRSDVKIVATAKASGATEFYTNDDNCRSLAAIVMKGKPLPKTSKELFIDEILTDGLEDKPKSRPARRRRLIKD